MSEKAVWEVIGGKDKGGILVREGRSIKSKELEQRLSFSAFVEEIELVGERLHYKLMTGAGPASGWVSINIGGKDLLKCIIKAPVKPPLFCAWYSGGFSTKDGEKLLAPLIAAVQAAGVKDTKVLHFPDGYGLEGEGRKPWAGYVDKLVEEINSAASDEELTVQRLRSARRRASAQGRPDLTWPCTSSAEVKKVYIAACGAMRLGEATPWETLSLNFKKGGDRELLQWFSSLQPENVVLRRTAMDTTDDEFEEQVKSSKFLSEMLALMRHQYRDAMYPDPDKDYKAVPAKVMAIAPIQDAGSQPEHMEGWGQLTSAGFQLEKVNAGHMDCLAPGADGKCELFEKLAADLQQFVP